GAHGWKPGTVTQRYRRTARRLGLRSTRLHSLRHYSASELVAAGVDLRTVAGRLGHGSGGATTLRVYSAWNPGADERAATVISKQLPRPGRTNDAEPILVNGLSLICRCGNASTWTSLRADGRHVSARCAECATMVTAVDPEQAVAEAEPDDEEPQSPYQLIAAQMRNRIVAGELKPGQPLPSLKEIMREHGCSMGTAHRAIALLAEDGLIITRRGFRAIVATA